jgi:hypothetical protein
MGIPQGAARICVIQNTGHGDPIDPLICELGPDRLDHPHGTVQPVAELLQGQILRVAVNAKGSPIEAIHDPLIEDLDDSVGAWYSISGRA